MTLSTRIEGLRNRILGTTTGLFAHAPYPLEGTLAYRGDPGLFGPGSATWPIIGDVSAFIGGIRALVVQAAHPEVVAGVHDHSRYREDPLGRLSRTSAYVTATAFGAMPEVEAAVAVVRRRHQPVIGESHRGVAYSAEEPEMAAWVHNALTDSFLAAYRAFGPKPISTVDADRFVAEQTKVGELLDADPLPHTAAGLTLWITEHPDAGRSPGMAEAMDFLRTPPLPLEVRIPYRLMFSAAVATIPVRLRRILGVRKWPGAILVGKVMMGFLRWALGSSTSWQAALLRVGSPVPRRLFRQPVRAAALGPTSKPAPER